MRPLGGEGGGFVRAELLAEPGPAATTTVVGPGSVAVCMKI
jgi:hypothetical protein